MISIQDKNRGLAFHWFDEYFIDIRNIKPETTLNTDIFKLDLIEYSTNIYNKLIEYINQDIIINSNPNFNLNLNFNPIDTFDLIVILGHIEKLLFSNVRHFIVKTSQSFIAQFCI